MMTKHLKLKIRNMLQNANKMIDRNKIKQFKPKGNRKMITFLYKKYCVDTYYCTYIDTDKLRSKPRNGDPLIYDAVSYTSDKIEMSKTKTVLSENELKLLMNYNGQDLTEIISKLESEDNRKLYAEICKEEKRDIMMRYHLSDIEYDELFSKYPYILRDKQVIDDIYENKYIFGRHIAWINGVFDYAEEDDDDEYDSDDFRYDLYIDFEKYGQDLVRKNNHYIEFAGGRVADVNFPCCEFES